MKAKNKVSGSANEDWKSGTKIVGLLAFACIIVGIGSIVAALFAFFGGEFVGAGLCLLAAALAFGLLANAVLRE